MTAHEFGMWGLSTLVWLFTAFSAVWGYHLVRHLIREFVVSRVAQELVIQEMLEGNVEIITKDDDQIDDEY
jgi:uncharacterized membrane protein YdjX (TVP38/TMEM64 family)